MENVLETREYKVSEFKDLDPPFVEKEDNATSTPKVNISSEESVNLESSLNELSSPIEDSGKLFRDIFGKRDVILKEKWDVSENVQGKVISVNESDVSVDCLVDIESKTFQYRTFPINLFKHINGLSQDKMVIIKTRMKAGAMRVDVYNGEGIVNDKLFKQKDNWNSLVGSGLDDKLTKW